MMCNCKKINLKGRYFMEKQQTLAQKVRLSGIALHTGIRATLNLVPADENTGIVFRRIDIDGQPEVKASALNVVDVQRGTTIASGKAVVYTVEHIMSALHSQGIDNCIVEMDGLEPPIADGSALPYYNMVAEAGGAV
jgi:UDP-3-O-acyl-N-acetylglucosamine deacetylase